LRALNYTAPLAALLALSTERNQRPRKVYENPKLYTFESTNFELLIKIFSQVADADRASFVSGVLDSVREPTAHRQTSAVPFPSFNWFTSALALVAEFCVRTGYWKELLAATAVPELPTPGLAVMLKEIEEMIALNFNLLSDNDLQLIPQGFARLREISHRQLWSQRRRGGVPGAPLERNPHYRQGFSDVGKEIVAAIDGITEECRQARYWYLKGALQELPNLEIESDRLKVEDYLLKLGFSSEMVASLNAAESDFKSTANAFELKNCLDHLRSFLEHLHRESARRIAAKEGNTVADEWGTATRYLKQEGYFTVKHEAFVTSLYTLLSDESVHALMADREYARLLRNVVIEYGVMFLAALDKRGVNLNKTAASG
jgi:hypothetical protein